MMIQTCFLYKGVSHMWEPAVFTLDFNSFGRYFNIAPINNHKSIITIHNYCWEIDNSPQGQDMTVTSHFCIFMVVQVDFKELSLRKSITIHFPKILESVLQLRWKTLTTNSLILLLLISAGITCDNFLYLYKPSCDWSMKISVYNNAVSEILA